MLFKSHPKIQGSTFVIDIGNLNGSVWAEQPACTFYYLCHVTFKVDSYAAAHGRAAAGLRPLNGRVYERQIFPTVLYRRFPVSCAVRVSANRCFAHDLQTHGRARRFPRSVKRHV